MGFDFNELNNHLVHGSDVYPNRGVSAQHARMALGPGPGLHPVKLLGFSSCVILIPPAI